MLYFYVHNKKCAPKMAIANRMQDRVLILTFIKHGEIHAHASSLRQMELLTRNKSAYCNINDFTRTEPGLKQRASLKRSFQIYYSDQMTTNSLRYKKIISKMTCQDLCYLLMILNEAVGRLTSVIGK